MCLPASSVLDDLAQRVGRGLVDDIGQVKDAVELGVQALGGHHVDANPVGPGSDAVRRGDLRLPSSVFDHRPDLHGFELREPAVPAEIADQGFQRGGGGLFQVELAGEQLDIPGLDVFFRQLEVEIRDLPADGASAAQPDDPHLRRGTCRAAPGRAGWCRRMCRRTRTRCACRKSAPTSGCSGSGRPG